MNTRRLTVIISGVIVAAIFIATSITLFTIKKKNEVVVPKIIVPNKKTQTEDLGPTENYDEGELEKILLIELNMDESLISALSIDFNNDGYEDQVIAVKKTNSPNISIVFGIYDVQKSSYERKMEVRTPISQVKTLNIISMDLIGNHTNSLVITGFASNNNSVMIAYAPKISLLNHDKLTLAKIVDLQTDGTIFIKETTRSDSYSIYNMNEPSFPIITNSTEETKEENNFDQIETIYDWNPMEFKYTMKSSSKVSSQRIAAKELARIQDGKSETFFNFLDGLWYKATESKSEQNIFFNPQDKEIIFSSNDTQEVYTILSSTPRRNGIFISTSNKSISNLVRYFHIDLVSTNEIRIRITDELRMVIGTEANWDGLYRKMDQTRKNEKTSKPEKNSISEFLEKDNQKWEFQNYSVIFRENTFTIADMNAPEKHQSGVYTSTKIHNYDLLQFRPDSEFKNCKLNGFFIYKKSSDRLDLIPVTLTTETCVISGNTVPIRLEKYKAN